MSVSFLHPRDERLTQLALDRRSSTDTTVERHVAACARCQATVQSIRLMRASLMATEPIAADSSQLARILDRRAAGERVMLADPMVSPMAAPGSMSRPRVVGALLITATIAASVIIWNGSRQETQTAGAVATVTDTLPPPPAADSPLSFLAPWPNVAYAAPVPRDTGVRFEPLRVSAYSPGALGSRTFVRSSASSYSGYRPIGAITVGIVDTTWRKVRVWRVVTTEPLAGRTGRSDTAWIRQSDLKLLLRRSHSYGSLRTQRAVGDTVLEETFEMRPPPEFRRRLDQKALKHTYTRSVDTSRLLITDLASFMLLMRSQPLHRGWRLSLIHI